MPGAVLSTSLILSHTIVITTITYIHFINEAEAQRSCEINPSSLDPEWSKRNFAFFVYQGPKSSHLTFGDEAVVKRQGLTSKFSFGLILQVWLGNVSYQLRVKSGKQKHKKSQ